MEYTVDYVWKKMQEHEGETFHTKTGLDFTYKMHNGYFVSSRVRNGYNIGKSDIQKALEVWSCKGPSNIPQSVRGPTYVWGILNDKRILGNRSCK